MDTDAAVAAQIDLIKRLRVVRAKFPKWASEERIKKAQATDPECIRLGAIADQLWSQAS